MTYTRARLILNTVNVIFWVLFSFTGLAIDLPRQLFQFLDANAAETALRVALLVVGYLVISFPFDLIGGLVLPSRFKRPAPSAGAFLLGWLRGALLQGVLFWLVGMLYLTAGKQSRSNMLLTLFLALAVSLALLVLQEPLARLMGGIKRVKPDLTPFRQRLDEWGMSVPDEIVVYESANPAFSGGLVGLLGIEKPVIPARWLKDVESGATLLARRLLVLQSESRARGAFAALAWNLLGLWLCFGAAGTEALTTSRGLFAMVMWFTLWSAAGMALLPILTRPAVLEADRLVRKQGASQQVMEALLEASAEEENAPEQPIVEFLFYPTPSADTRLVELSRRNTRYFGTWNATHLTQYLSWACLGLLSRAAYGVQGQPELWVMLPSD